MLAKAVGRWRQLGEIQEIRLCSAPASDFARFVAPGLPFAIIAFSMTVRNAKVSEIERLAKIWFDGWQDAHSQLLPKELALQRTLESFRGRIVSALDRVRVLGPTEEPLGFCMTKGSELYQLYVSSEARGSGLAAALILDAETRLAVDGVPKAWLTCAIGNERAARFYEKRGWIRTGSVIENLEVESGTFPLLVWRYEKLLK